MKKIFQHSLLHIHLWFFKETIRAIIAGTSVHKILPFYSKYIESNRDRSKTPLDLGMPWITYGAIKKLENILHKNMRVFEYGSGGSTRFFAERASEVYSVEHYHSWYLKVKEELAEFSNLHLSWKPGVQLSGSFERAVLDEAKDGIDYHEYVNSILEFPASHFDLILIDGRARNACIQNAIGKLKPGGFLVLDNSNRRSYTPSLNLLEPWFYECTLGPSHGSKKFTQTSIYKKPDHGL
ncbi:hypothetical protein J0A67_04870 [Algoriphagus aestuariicola]|uniref:Class I SAM-dependent methyltransferase n=1 Tax=Algoriphagus aestuariicola TaxID=1852016 RepID=A0ABS3BM90_9BACT|nr:hypothetical protein [Algoriphagus aestuariicola]MBN7800180.1 hypothetical protein [Algoriphagus aestuariicola]